MRAPLERMRIRSQGLSESGALHNLFGDRVRTYPNGKARPHAGWDLEASIGTPVLAIEAGEIVMSDTLNPTATSSLFSLDFKE